MKPPKLIRDASLPLNSDAARRTFHMWARPDYKADRYLQPSWKFKGLYPKRAATDRAAQRACTYTARTRCMALINGGMVACYRRAGKLVPVKARKAKPEPEPKRCAACDKPFQAKRRDARFCSQACQKWARRPKANYIYLNGDQLGRLKDIEVEHAFQSIDMLV
jgi:hypothetical protein